MGGEAKAAHRTFQLLVLALALLGLHVSSLYSYLLFHSLVEIARITVLFSVFVLAWHSRQWSKNNYIVFLGISYLFVGSLELLHALAYKGMGVFASNDANLATQLWVAFRYLESVSVIAAAFVIGKRLIPAVAFAGYSLVTVVLGAAIFLGVFPDCFIEGEGLTPFKIESEYIICGLFLLGIVLLVSVRGSFDRSILLLLVASLAISAAAEIAFTQYVSVYGLANEVGHLLLLLSAYCLYRAVLVSGIVNPFSLLFRSLKRKEAELEAAVVDCTAALTQSEERSRALVQARAAEAKLHAADARLAAIIRCSSDAIISLSPNGIILSWNEAAERMFGYSAEEAIGREAGFLLPPGSDDGPRGLFDRALAGERITVERTRRRKDGTTIEVLVSIAPVCDESGAPIGVSAVLHDITERKQREEHIEFLMREISHRSKNLLGVVMAISNQTARHCSEIEEFQARFEGRLHSLARSYDALLSQNWQGVELGMLVETQLEAFDMSRFDVSGPPARVNAVAAQHIGLALYELATNASKYGALAVPPGRVKIEWRIGPEFSMSWAETGGPIVKSPERKGFGHKVLGHRAFTNASAALEFSPEGVRWTLNAAAADVLEKDALNGECCLPAQRGEIGAASGQVH